MTTITRTEFEDWYRQQYGREFPEPFEFVRRDQLRPGDLFWSSFCGAVEIVKTVSSGETTDLHYKLHRGQSAVLRNERCPSDSHVPRLARETMTTIDITPDAADVWRMLADGEAQS